MHRTGLLSGTGLLALMLAANAANAQTATTAEVDQLQQQIQQLEQQHQQQIQQLQQQLQTLQTQINAQAQATPAATAPAAAGPHATQSATNRFGIESADGQYSMALTGRLNLDMGGYPSFHPSSHAAGLGLNDLNSGVNARRARLGVVGKFAGDWNYSFIYDFGGSSDTLNTTTTGTAGGTTGAPGGFTSGIENAYVTYNGLYNGPVPLAFDLGYQDTPFTLDEATSSNDIMFMERSSSQVIATAFGFGDSRSAAGVRSNSDLYWAGIYATGPASGAPHTVGEPLAAFGRFTFQALTGPDYSWHVGADLGGLLKPAAAANGAAFLDRTLSLSDRPELRIDPTSPSTTNAFLDAALGPTAATPGAPPVNGGSVLDIETAGGIDNWFVQGEGYNYRVSRAGLPANTFWGGYLESSLTLTGEHRTYIPATGAYSGIVPAHPFSIKAGGWGAFELAARFSFVNLNDNYNPLVAGANGGAVTTNSVEGGRQIAYGLGINWYLNPNMRFMLDYMHVIDKKTGTGAAAPQLGADIDEIGARAQVAF